MNIAYIIITLIFSGAVAFFTFRIASYTKVYTAETRKLWEITKKSYFVKAVADHIFEKYYNRIEEWPSEFPAWTAFLDWKFPPGESQKPQVFKEACNRVILEELFPEIVNMEQRGIEKIKGMGFKFREDTRCKK